MNIKKYAKCPILKSCTIGVVKNSRNVTAAIHIPMRYLSTTNPFLMLRRNSIEDICCSKKKDNLKQTFRHKPPRIRV